MSKEAAIAFLKKVTENAELQQKLVAFARQQGYDFSVEELTDAELGGVTGGALNAYFNYTGPTLATPTLSSPTPSPQLGEINLLDPYASKW